MTKHERHSILPWVRSFGHTARSALALDFSNFERGFAVRSSVGVAIPLVATLLFHQPQLGVAAAIGALSTGFASRQGVYRTRAAAMLATALGMSLSMLAGGYAAHSTPAMIAVTALWGYLYGLVCSLGPAASAAGLNSVVALVVADAFSGSSIASVPYEALFVLLGGLEQTLLLVVLWPARRYANERHALGDAYRALGQYAQDLGATVIASPHPGVIASVRTTLADPAPFSRRGDIAVFQALLDEAERVRATLAGLVTDRYRYERRHEAATLHAIARLGQAVAPLLEEIATALHEARAPITDDAEWRRAEEAASALDTLPGAIGKHARTQAHALLGQLRTAWRIACAPAAERASFTAKVPPPRYSLPSFTDALLTIRANLGFNSPFGRHAARLAVALGIAMAIARLAPIHRGYWIAMTAALVLRPDFRTTFTRGFARIAGTLLGAVLATAIVALVHPSTALVAGLAVFFAAIGYFVFTLNYAIYTLTVTAYVVFLLALIGTAPEHASVLSRSIATLLGAFLAGAVYLLWPTWESRRVRIALAEQLDAYRRYAHALLNGCVDPSSLDRKRLRELQSAAWQTRAHAEASVDTMIADPERTHTLSPRVSLGVLAAAARLGVAQLTLNAYLESVAKRSRPAVEPLANAIDAALRRCVQLLRERSAEGMPPLRELYRNAEAALGDAEDPDAAVVLAECDLIVDGVNTINELLANPRPRK